MRKKEEFLEFPDQEDAIFLRFAKDCAVPKGKTVLNYSLDVLEAGGEILARDIVLWVQGPVHVGIIGKNGCGKTTLLRKIAENLLERKDIKTAYMPQNYEEIMDLEKTAVNFLVKTGDKRGRKTYTDLSGKHEIYSGRNDTSYERTFRRTESKIILTENEYGGESSAGIG